MSGVLRCSEFGQVAVGADGFSEHELEHLVRLREGAPFFSEERRAGSWFCRFGGYAGAIVLPSGRTLELLPKIASEGEVEARALVMRMLAATGLAPALDADIAAYASSPHLLEAYLRLASVMAQQQLRRGLVHAYRRLELRLPVVRGRLRVGAQLARLPQRVDAHLLQADEFTADTTVNRAIKGSIRRIQRLAQLDETHGRCRELLARLDSVGETPPNGLAELLSGLALDRRHAHLEPLISILRLIVVGYGSAVSAGADTPGPTLLFAMERLFEAYVAQRLRRVANGLDVRVQGPERWFARDGRFSLRPDLVVFEGRRPILILDTKWKLLSDGISDVAASDLQQAFTYARVYRVSRVFLLYPGVASSDCLRSRFEVNDGSSIEICIEQLPLLGPGEDLDQALAQILDHAYPARCASQSVGSGRSSFSSMSA